MEKTKEFAQGIIFKQPHEKAPDFVVGKLSLKVQDVLNWLSGKSEEWINLDINLSREGKPYVCVNNWKKQQQAPDTSSIEEVTEAFEEEIIIPGE